MSFLIISREKDSLHCANPRLNLESDRVIPGQYIANDRTNQGKQEKIDKKVIYQMLGTMLLVKL